MTENKEMGRPQLKRDVTRVPAWHYSRAKNDLIDNARQNGGIHPRGGRDREITTKPNAKTCRQQLLLRLEKLPCGLRGLHGVAIIRTPL